MMLKSESSVINLIATINEKDSRTIHGNNLKNIANDCGTTIEDLSSYIVKKEMKFFRVPHEEQWRIPLVKELMETKHGDLKLSELDNNDLNEMVKMLTTT